MTKKTKKMLQRKPIQRRSQQTRDAILKATAQILLKSGLEGLNSNSIAERAGVSIGSFYQYYANKESALSDLITERMNLLLLKINEALVRDGENAKKNPREFLKNLMISLLQEFKKDQLLALLMFQYSHVIADQNRMEKVDQDLIPMIAKAIQASVPRLRKKNVELSVYVVLQSYRGLVAISSARKFKGLDIEELADELTDLFWRYLSADVLE